MSENHDSTAQNSAGGADGEDGSVSVEPVHFAEMGDSVNQDNRLLVMGSDTVQDDMFVDCPEELIAFDGRNNVTDNREAIEISDSQQEVQENEISEAQRVVQANDDMEKTLSNESGNGKRGDDFTGELEYLRATLEKIVGEKESLAQEYEAEKMLFMQELSKLCYQLNALSTSTNNENDSEFVDHPYESEMVEGENKFPISNAKLHELIYDCSKFIKHAVAERSQTQGTIKELRAILHKKDQEIEDLSARGREFSVPQDIVAITNRVLESVASTVNEENLVDESFAQKMFRIENATLILINKYNSFLSETDVLRQCLMDVNPDHAVQEDDMGIIFLRTREELLELRRKEVNFTQKAKVLEDENWKLMEQLNKDREMADSSNEEIRKLRVELEQEKARYNNTKEKLSLAVTKGKALVQQRDSLKQSLADKANELEKHLIELQEKSSALEAAELMKEELVRSETKAASLQEALSASNTIIEKLEEILSESGAPEELQSMDIIERVRWLVHEANTLRGISLEFRKMTKVLSAIDLPENIPSLNLNSQISWLAESFYKAKEETTMLQDEIFSTREAAHNEIDRLTVLVLAETQEKNYLQEEFEDLRYKYEGIVHKEHQLSLEKDQVMMMLLGASGIAMDSPKEIHSEIGMVIDRCFGKVKEQARADFECSHVEVEMFEKIQSLLYIRDHEAFLFEKILEEEILNRSETNDLANKIAVISQELRDLKEEKDSLQNDLSRSEEKAALLREKLSMAVKKGKGLVQERENMKQLMEEKNALIQKLKLEIDQKGTALNDFVDQINKLSTDVGRIPKLEVDLSAMKEQRDQLERFLAESNSMLHRLIESIDSIVPGDSAVEEPVEKVKWLAEYFSECEIAKERAQQELETVKDEASILSNKLAEVQTSMKSLEDEFSVAKNNILQLAEEKKELEVSKSFVEQELHKAMEEASSETHKFAEVLASNRSLEDALALAKEQAQLELETVKDEASTLSNKLAEVQTIMKSLEHELSVAKNSILLLAEEKKEVEVAKSFVEQELHKAIEEASSETHKFVEVFASKKSLEDALALAENNISVLITEKEDAQVRRATTEAELLKVKEEVSFQISKLAEAHKTIQSLEDAMSQLKINESLLAEENNIVQVGRTSLENEMKLLKEEADSQVCKLADASSTIKSLENAVLKAEITISDLVRSKDNAEKEIQELNTQLNACMEELGAKENAEEEVSNLKSQLNSCLQELAGTPSKENRYLELSGYLKNLQCLLKDETLLSLLRQSSLKKIEGLKDIDRILKDIRDHIVEMDSNILQSFQLTEENSSGSYLFPPVLDNALNVEMVNGEVNAIDVDNVTLYIGKTLDHLQVKNMILADNFESSSAFIDGLIAALMEKLLATRDGVTVMLEQMKTLEQNVKSMETDKQVLEQATEILENNITILSSACRNVTQELKLEVESNLLESGSGSGSELGELNHSVTQDASAVGKDAGLEHQSRLDSSKYVDTADNLFSAARNVKKLIKQLQNVRKMTSTTVKNLQDHLKETSLAFEKVMEERDLNLIRVSKLEADLEAVESSCSEMRIKLGEYQIEVDKWKEREAELTSLYTTSMKEHEDEEALLSTSQMKALFDKIKGIEIPVPEFEVGELKSPGPVEKLFHIIGCVSGLQHQITLLSHDNELQQLTLEKQVLEIEHLKEEVAKHIIVKQDSENMKHELFELTLGLENIIQKFGSDGTIGRQKSAGITELPPIIEKRVAATILETENLKSKAQELEAQLLGSQKVVDELSNKVKLLENNPGREASADSIQERGIFEAQSLPTRSEISEIEDVGAPGKKPIPSAPANALVRTLRKGSSDHLAISIDSETGRLINAEDADEDKGHVFKPLNTSGFIPRQGRMIADRIDGLWVSGGRALTSRPRARLGLIAYWLFLHIWLLGTIL